MPQVRALFGEAAFDAETTLIIAAAFDLAWLKLQGSQNPLASPDSAASTRNLLARWIIGRARRGDIDAESLADEAVRAISTVHIINT